MAKTTLCLETIADLDNGTAGPLIDREIARAVADLVDRGEEDGKARKVVIQLELTIKNGIVVTDVTADAKLPPKRTRSTATEARYRDSEPVLCFQTHNPDRADQPTFDALEGKE